MPNYTQYQIATVLKGLGEYRVIAAQDVADDVLGDGITGALMLAVGLRETGLRNINNPADTDHGCFQISELYHLDFLVSEPGVLENQWRVQEGSTATADDTGFCPRYTPALVYAHRIICDATLYARSKGYRAPVRFALAAYNAGLGGALAGYKAGDVDKFTTHGDYSAWVMFHKPMIQKWIDLHPSWQPKD